MPGFVAILTHAFRILIKMASEARSRCKDVELLQSIYEPCIESAEAVNYTEEMREETNYDVLIEKASLLLDVRARAHKSGSVARTTLVEALYNIALKKRFTVSANGAKTEANKYRAMNRHLDQALKSQARLRYS